MLQSSTLRFLKELAGHNNKEWFDANRSRYEAARADFIELADAIIRHFSKKDKDFEQLEGRKCLFRINRDVRFSKNKSPYKTNLGASFERGGRISPYAGYYLHIEPGNKSFVAGGLWMPEAERIKKVRQEIDYNWDTFRKIIQHKTFRTVFGDLEKTDETSLKREPKGYEKDNPAIEYLKLKSWIVSAPLTDKTLTDPQLLRQVLQSFEAMRPFIAFLNEALAE